MVNWQPINKGLPVKQKEEDQRPSSSILNFLKEPYYAASAAFAFSASCVNAAGS